MKKLLLALLAVTGFSMAQAQSSVTMYGILDLDYSGVNTRGGATKTTTNKFDQSGETSSLLGFKGAEDLGGGTSALFTYEMGLYPQDATLSGNTNNGIYNRQAFVGIKQNGIGQVALGTQYTPLYTSVAATDPGALNNVVGSVIIPANGSLGVTTSAFTERASNALTVQSATFAGFNAGAMYSLNNSNTTQTGPNTGGTTNINGWGLNANYTYEKFLATLAYQSFRNENPSTTVTPVANVNTNDNGSNVNDTQKYVGATYDFGILKAYASWVNRKAISGLNSNAYLNRSGEQIGVRAFITPRIESWASYGMGKYTAYGVGSPTANYTGFQIGSNYYLSKRTNLYAIVGSTAASGTSGTPSAGANQYALGVKHTF